MLIVLEVEALFIDLVFEGYFENTNEGQIVSCFFNEVSDCFWFQSPLNLLSEEQMASYIVSVHCQILIFLYV